MKKDNKKEIIISFLLSFFIFIASTKFIQELFVQLVLNIAHTIWQ